MHQLELLPRPPQERAADNPWPQWPQIFRVSTAHEEGGERLFAVSTERFSGDAAGHVRALHAVKVEMVKKDGRVQFVRVEGSEFEIPADLVLLAMGFVGAEKGALARRPWRDDDRSRQRRSRRAMDDERPRRVHRRRHAARPVADRVGDRRGPQRRAGDRSIPDGRVAASRAARLNRIQSSTLDRPNVQPERPTTRTSALVRSSCAPCASLRKFIQFDQLAALVEIGRNMKSACSLCHRSAA